MGQECVRVITQHLGDLAVDQDSLEPIVWVADCPCRVTAVALSADAAVNAADTNYTTWVLTNGSTTIATIADGPVLTGSSLAAGAFTAATVTTTVADREVAKDDVLTFQATDTGDGLAIPGATLKITIEAL